ncbi:MAG: orotate phosphoribosyltransferase [Candidatus Omnitrophica bacterium CG11_big_fil_rev_8_21_14_0_20_64_10]|nr:MAG: orotate phosphoribosyltransferase [Candidatus Omnitrophica bacterium CG11_big_fil_rev_8_21_14_0_20_64_10]
MRPSEVSRIFRASDAWQTGHFELTSGKHSQDYFQCAKVLQYPTLASRLCEALAEPFFVDEPTCVAAPAMGGILVGYESARHLGVRSIFAERKEGKLQFRRSFQVGPQDRVLVVEDVVTTGGSVHEVVTLARDAGATVVGIGAFVDRSGGWASFDVKFHALLSLQVKTFDRDNCPLCKEGVPLVKPGSRSL